MFPALNMGLIKQYFTVLLTKQNIISDNIYSWTVKFMHIETLFDLF